MVSTPDGLSDWFADSVSNNQENIYTFKWGLDEEEARMLASKSGEMIRFQWIEDEEDGIESYFEFAISPIPSDPKNILLTITDFAEKSDKESSQMFWEKQISILKRKLGA
jgi:hypothetical protein